MSKVKKLALCALMTASSVVVMFLGSISGFLDICTAAVAALIVAFFGGERVFLADDSSLRFSFGLLISVRPPRFR